MFILAYDGCSYIHFLCYYPVCFFPVLKHASSKTSPFEQNFLRIQISLLRYRIQTSDKNSIFKQKTGENFSISFETVNLIEAHYYFIGNPKHHILLREIITPKLACIQILEILVIISY